MTILSKDLQSLLERIRQARIGILGDFCLDVYLQLDMSASEISVETGLATHPVRSQRYALGGAGNVANNLCALGAGHVSVFGLTGMDPYGKEMRDILASQRITIDGLLIQPDHWDTHVYTKPYEGDVEQHRMDFGNFNHLDPRFGTQVLEQLAAHVKDLDLVIVNQQVMSGIHTAAFRKQLASFIQEHAHTRFIVDSRHHADDYAGAMRKLNVREAARLCGRETSDPDAMDAAEIEALARTLHTRWGSCVFMTGGERGCFVYDQTGYKEIPGLLILSPVDPVGAGDSMLAGIAAALAVGADPSTAADLGNLTAGVTVQKLMQTGTASPAEILRIGTDPDCRYHPDLARQPRKATYVDGSEIEIVNALPRRRAFAHAVFDHDGTISTLRQGWEGIMEPMMINAILGPKQQHVDDGLYDRVVSAVRSYIDRTTGIQTLVQMKGLVGLVRQFKCITEQDILDEHGYKAMYNEALLGMVKNRIGKLRKGQLQTDDFAIKGAVRFLQALHARGVQLYLASGTDQADVEEEASVLGYRDLFGNRIFGAVGDITRDAKRLVLERILGGITETESAGIVTLGDGPVEIRETHKRGGYTIGVASDEIRRYGLNIGKRRRLVEAGADLVIPDFCELDTLMSLLFS
jgi:rfaE bifunctional protein kinase chain/domain